MNIFLNHRFKSMSGLVWYLSNVVNEILVSVLWMYFPQLCQSLQVALNLVLFALQCETVVHHWFGLLHFFGCLGVTDGSSLHCPLVLHLLWTTQKSITWYQ